jgi:hypothetical protein
MAFVAVASVCANASAIMVTLTDKDINAAVEEGQRHAKEIEEVVVSECTFGGSHLFEENGVIRTKWCKLATLAALHARQKKELDAKCVKEVVENTELQIDVHTFGYRINFAEAYGLAIEQGGKRIKASKVHADHFEHMAGRQSFYKGFPSYWATVRGYFPYAELDSDGRATVILIKGKAESRFTIDLGNYR